MNHLQPFKVRVGASEAEDAWNEHEEAEARVRVPMGADHHGPGPIEVIGEGSVLAILADQKRAEVESNP